MSKGRPTTAREGSNPFKKLVYIYIGTSKYDEDRDYYENKLGAKLLWEFSDFGARVAGFDLCGEPYLLIADHVKAPSKRLIYEVDDLHSRGRGSKATQMEARWRQLRDPGRPLHELQGRER